MSGQVRLAARIGLSPRVRGNRTVLGVQRDLNRSIPARAGQPLRLPSTRQSSWVYPRACGATHHYRYLRHVLVGLSPRVRGNPRVLRILRRPCGSIPARAGQPTRPRRIATVEWVYPRACGATGPHVTPGPLHSGLSPRVRGNPIVRRYPGPHHRSIPARAGQPLRRPSAASPTAVYPRACGATESCAVGNSGVYGLSPRVRGNRRALLMLVVTRRSIPARAGQPGSHPHLLMAGRVYPRACGATHRDPHKDHKRDGLSPRVRGNQSMNGALPVAGRSIPARAGQPYPRQDATRQGRVYPRACGATRGNLAPCRTLTGSIPARAGQPGRTW